MTDALPIKAITLHEPADLQTRFDRAVYWLSEAVRVDDAIGVRSEAEQLKLVGRQAKDRTLQANAAVLQLRAERRLGEILIEAKQAGQMSKGGRKFSTGSGSAPVSAKVVLAEAGIDKKLSSKAQKLASTESGMFDRIVAEAREKILAGRATLVNPVKDAAKAEKALRRRIREAQLASKAKALPAEQYQVIYADPEWQFETYSEGGLDRSADNHYPTSDLTTIKARPVGTLAAPDCVLFLWATVPMLPQALEVMRFWGFEYKSHWCWDKVDVGTGYWNRNQHELLLVGTRGSIPAPAPGTQYPSVMTARKGAHSEKPDWAYELIEAYFPNLKKIELNARRLRDGWAAWGFEAPEDEATGLAPTDPLRSEAGTREGAGAAASGGEAAALPAGISHAPGEPAITGAASLAPVAPVSPLDDPGFVPAFLAVRPHPVLETAP